MRPKDRVPDHWTWRDGKPEVTGWHKPVKRGRKAEDQGPVFEPRVSRGSVAASKPKRPKPEQGSLL